MIATAFNQTSIKSKLVVVTIGDAAVSGNTEESIITYALGSCIGLTLYDPRIKVAGLLHFLLPSARVSSGPNGPLPPLNYADTGIPLLVEAMEQLGARRTNLVVKAAGGAKIQKAPDMFDVGNRNHLAMRKALWSAGLGLHAEAVGGTAPRTLKIDVATGDVIVSSQGQEQSL